MKFKISNSEILALSEMMLQDCEAYRQNRNNLTITPVRMLTITIIEEMVLKLMQKSLIKKDKYSISWTSYQAIAFWLHYNGVFPPVTQLGNMVQKLCNAIHQQVLCKK